MGRPINKLSVAEVSAKTKPGLYADGGGLYLQVSAFGTKAWVYRFMMAGEARKMGLGPVKLTPKDKTHVSLEEARTRAGEAAKLVRDGIDPIEARKSRKAAQQFRSFTFKQAAERYIKDHAAGWKSAKHAGQWTTSLETYAYPKIGSLSVNVIDRRNVLDVLEPIWLTKTETASRLRGRIESVLNWAKASGYRDGDNPADWKVLKHVLPARSAVAPIQNHKAVHYTMLPQFMAELRKLQGISARALEFTILTAARTGDTIGATWSEIDKKERLWTVPAARLKGRKGARKRDHIIPLSDAAFKIIKALPTEDKFVFPGRKKNAALSNMAMLELLRGMNLEDGLTVHGFRSAFKDWAAEQTAYPNELSEMALSHAVGDKVEAAYRRGDMLEKRKRMMADWAAYCSGSGATGSNVVKIGRGK